MKKLVLLFILFASFGFSQNFQGKAIYKTHRKVDIKVSSSGGDAFQKKLQESLKKMYQKTYVLNFSKTESTYKQEKELAPVAKRGNVMVKMISGSTGSDMLYKNTKENTYKNQKEISGKRFLIEDTLPKKDWEMTGETKKIGNYTCYKATKTKEVTRKSFVTVDGKKEETEKKEIIVTTVWYTPQIPISNGPAMFGGLPGLILEVQDGKETIVCSEVVLNPKEKVVIKKPKRGKKVTQKEFDNIMSEHTKEFIERFKSSKTKKGKGNVISININ